MMIFLERKIGIWKEKMKVGIFKGGRCGDGNVGVLNLHLGFGRCATCWS